MGRHKKITLSQVPTSSTENLAIPIPPDMPHEEIAEIGLLIEGMGKIEEKYGAPRLPYASYIIMVKKLAAFIEKLES